MSLRWRFKVCLIQRIEIPDKKVVFLPVYFNYQMYSTSRSALSFTWKHPPMIQIKCPPPPSIKSSSEKSAAQRQTRKGLTTNRIKDDHLLRGRVWSGSPHLIVVWTPTCHPACWRVLDWRPHLCVRTSGSWASHGHQQRSVVTHRQTSWVGTPVISAAEMFGFMGQKTQTCLFLSSVCKSALFSSFNRLEHFRNIQSNFIQIKSSAKTFDHLRETFIMLRFCFFTSDSVRTVFSVQIFRVLMVS